MASVCLPSTGTLRYERNAFQNLSGQRKFLANSFQLFLNLKKSLAFFLSVIDLWYEISTRRKTENFQRFENSWKEFKRIFKSEKRYFEALDENDVFEFLFTDWLKKKTVN